MVHQMGRALRHAPSTAARTHRSGLAGEGDEPIQPAPVTPKTGEPAGQPPTAQKPLELLLDEPRQALPAPRTDRRGPEGFEVIAHDLVQHALCGRSRFVALRRSGHIPA